MTGPQGLVQASRILLGMELRVLLEDQPNLPEYLVSLPQTARIAVENLQEPPASRLGPPAWPARQALGILQVWGARIRLGTGPRVPRKARQVATLPESPVSVEILLPA